MNYSHSTYRLVVKGTRLYEEGDIIDCVATMQTSNQVAWDANAERLAACWNACIGIPSYDLARQEEPSIKQQRLMELADRIDCDQLWRLSGIDQRNLSQEQRDRLDAGVALRRYADLWQPGRWIVFPPTGPVHFSASTLEQAAKNAKKGYVP